MARLYDTRAYRAARTRLHPLPCHYCGKTPAGTIDHVKPIMLGGTNAADYLVPCCQACNTRRGNEAQHLKRLKRRERSKKW